MLDPEDVGRRLEKHFAEVSDEEFLRRLKRAMPEDEWEQVMRSRVPPRRPGVVARARLILRKLLSRPEPVGPAGSGLAARAKP
ncbi:hypothetical protein [Longimicrobium sp.]|uniref:hypothetical protein n=1 Tax=Longimicrobium sp. TaxID=2029185 RepID=UPI002D0655F9|nr:hypothetical protein [Longimicrobium sp.]HSU12905.1 hypothetical protein [Longimicrobium sp.]